MLMFYFIMVLAFMAPGLPIPGLATIWVTDILLLLVFTWRIISPPQMSEQYKFYIHSTLMIPLYISYVWLTLVTIITLSATPEAPLGLTVFSLLGRLRPLFFLWLMSPYCDDRQKLFKIFRFLMVLFALQFFVVCCQKFNIAGVNIWYTPRFRILDVFVDESYLLGGRTIGSIGNPNSLGTFMSVFAMLGYSVYAFGSGYRRWIGFLVAVIAFIVCVFFASTRQGALTIILGCGLLSVVALFIGKFGRLIFAMVLVMLSLPIFLFYLTQDYSLFERFGVLRGQTGVTEVSSVQVRLQLWPQFFGEYGLWVLIGKGMAGMIASTTWDSGWLMLVVGGGLPLAMFYLWWLLRVSRACLKALPYRENAPDLTGFLLAGLSTAFIVMLTNLVNNTYSDTKIALIVGMIFMLSLSAAYQLIYGDYEFLNSCESEALFIPDGSDDRGFPKDDQKNSSFV